MLGADVRGQEFPYVAPPAPEFDGRGNLVREAAKPGQYDSSGRQSPITPQAPIRMEAPPAPNGSAARLNAPTSPVVAPQAPGYAGRQDTQSKPARQASVPQIPDYQQTMRGPSPATSTQPQPQPIQRQDCSQYPMLIANSRSEAEMQMTARHYLTCLMQNGWSMDQARQQVISTIESTYRVAQ